MARKGDAFSQFELNGWERAAGKYESAWSGLTKLFVPRLIEAARVGPDSRVLDVACGPGYVAEAACTLGASATGVDFSPEMVRLARSRNPDIPYQVGDAHALDFDDESFDAVLMNFGVLHLSDPEAAFAEARRVLRHGGRFGFTAWASPEHSTGARIVEEAIEAHANLNVDVPAGPHPFGYGEAETCREALGRLGFDPASLKFRTVTASWKVPSAAFVFEAEREAGVRTTALLTAQTPEALSAIRTQIISELRPYAKGKGFSIPYAAHVIAVSA